MLPAKCVANALMSSKEIRSRVSVGHVAKWLLCEDRKKQIEAIKQTGDLPISFASPQSPGSGPSQNIFGANLDLSKLTLERLHLLERPPRFPSVFFEFGSDSLTSDSKDLFKPVAELLLRHPTMKIRVEGRVQPDAPHWIKQV
ncbi:hypothetical protein TeGR_g6554, partial [Tetraparma gracilis]